MSGKLLLKIDFLKNYETNKMIYVNDIKSTLKHYSIKFDRKTKKKELKQLLYNFFNKSPHLEHEKIIIKMQRLFRKNFIKKFANTEDFYSLDPLQELDPKYLFWYRDSKEFIFGFDIRSFYKLTQSNSNNPYNREQIPMNAISKAHEIIKKRNINVNFDNSPLTEEQEHNLYMFGIFQKIDLLNAAAGGVNVSWFSNLSFSDLKKYYRALEDIWNYWAELNIQQKIKIDPYNKLFKINMNYILGIPNTARNKIKLQKIILNEIDTLISSAHNDSDKFTGCYYTLIALTEVSIDCANAMPWLVQY